MCTDAVTIEELQQKLINLKKQLILQVLRFQQLYLEGWNIPPLVITVLPSDQKETSINVFQLVKHLNRAGMKLIGLYFNSVSSVYPMIGIRWVKHIAIILNSKVN